MAPLLQFKAGRSFREGETNQVVSNPDRGLITLEEEDGLLHFYYKDLATSSILEDLIIFQGDASFQPANKQHRVSVLKFNSSSARHFFWHQDRELSDEQFEERGKKVNELIGGEELTASASEGMQVEEAAAPPSASTSTSSAPASTSTSTTTRGGPPPVSGQQALQLENILSAFRAASSGKNTSGSGGNETQAALESALRGAQAGVGAGRNPDFTLPDILTPSTLTSLINSLPASSLSHLSTFLPPSPSLPTTTPATQRTSLIRALTSPEFKRSTMGFERALRTGATGPVLRGLGMERGEEGVEEFLEEVQKGAEKEGKKDEEKKKEEGEGGADGGEEKMQE
ncbi:hypothetical protein JCM16303_005036 [Sporobolomyces ruberrimus]